MGFFYFTMSYDKSSDPVTREEFEELKKEHEETDSNVFDHEDAIGTLVWALCDEPSLSEDARAAIKEIHDKMFKTHPKI